MTKKQTNKGRTQVKDLPREEKELGKDEQKKVKGGYNQEEPLASQFNQAETLSSNVRKRPGQRVD